jgi:hypothetical protein
MNTTVVYIPNNSAACFDPNKDNHHQVYAWKLYFYCCTVHLDNIKIFFTNECTLY